MPAKKRNGTKKKEEKLLEVKRQDQYRTINELFEHSQPTAIYNTLLILSSFIIASGLLLGNSTVVIGGMLVTPVLTPVLVMGLGFATGEPEFIRKEGIHVIKSFLLIVASALVLTLMFGENEEPIVFDNTVRTAVLYFIVAIASGVAATFAWVRKELAEILPGIAIAVSLVPPLSLIGVGLGMLDATIVRVHFFIFLFNLLGVIVGSFGVFSLLKFARAEKMVHKKTKEI
jgi:uncharacterized hydrophobic protein (TIGR00271 family)